MQLSDKINVYELVDSELDELKYVLQVSLLYCDLSIYYTVGWIIISLGGLYDILPTLIHILI